MEDIWITPSTSKPPPWLEDMDVQAGIHATLKVERCIEEQKHLGIESDNLCRWFGRELGAIELALLNESSKSPVQFNITHAKRPHQIPH